MIFSEETINFLVENREKNNKNWFQAHKEDYQQYVLNPLMELVNDLTPFMQSIDSLIVCEPKVDKTISRIHRDTRFSKDKSLYREEVWLSFTRDKKSYSMFPQFFLVIRPNYYLYGCGYYAATADAMNSIRKLILAKDVTFLTALEDIKAQNIFQLEGEKYKKNNYPNEPEEIADWLSRKCVCMSCLDYDLNRLYEADFAEQLIQDFSKLASFYKFLAYAEEIK